jgi:hypothetical protein
MKTDEYDDLDEQLEAALLVLWELRLQATALGAKNIEVAAARAHGALSAATPFETRNGLAERAEGEMTREQNDAA